MNKISIPFVKKTTRDFIRQVRAAKTAAEERAIISKESAMIRNAFREEDKVNAQSNMAKLLFIHLMGYPSYFGQVESVKLIASPNFSDKRMGYLSLVILLSEDNDIFLLVTNTLKSDLNSKEHYVAGLALTAAANVCSEAMARDIFTDACLCMVRVLSKVPELTEDMIKSLPTLLGDEDHGVLISATSLTYYILKKNPAYIPKFRKLVPRLIKKMKVIISSGFKSEYNVGGVPDPFLQVEMLKLLCLLATHDTESSDALGDLLAFIATKTDSSCMAGNAVLYETVKTIMSIEAASGQRVLGANILGKFLLHSDSNIRYMAEVDHAAVSRHRGTIIGCLKESDPSIRRRALEVVFALVNLKNVEELVRELLNYLTVADDTERPELISRITSLVQQYAPSSLWQVDTLLAVLQVSGRYANEEVTSALISIVGNEEDALASYTIHKLFLFAQRDLTQVSLTQVAVWCIGEYGEELLEDYYDAARQQQLDAVSETAVLDLLERVLKTPAVDAMTKTMVLTALAKLADRFSEEALPRITALLKPFETSCVLQAQERACEYAALLSEEGAAVRQTVLDRMPPLDIDNAKARRAEEESEESEDSDTDSEEGESAKPAKPVKAAKAAKPAQPVNLMDDLLGLGAAPAGDSLGSDLAGVMDILGSVTAPAAPAAPATDPMDFSSILGTTGTTGTTGTNATAESEVVDYASPATVETSDPSTLTAFEEDGVKVVFKMKKGDDDSDTIIKATISNSNSADLEEFSMQAAVPKYMKVQMKPISDPVIPANNEDVSTQLIRIRNNAFGEKASVLKLRITYELNGESVTKVATVDEIPDHL
ncbi:adaptor protein complex 1, subunit gamma 1 [Blastocystis sp. ATCC 50177/Nand II]|uniref:AP-1 complex subunit gamma n=1 Tax=Blastocystis sp. subtype 1 (strain ATCC 50177 / NandII) TaxID=478820 RepID=A0A196S805_BLAHN|nr:adaptor protein complex 1, subunit gamma 1 [Blastocystis sp. ATCC 50177/Nand II]